MRANPVWPKLGHTGLDFFATESELITHILNDDATVFLLAKHLGVPAIWWIKCTLAIPTPLSWVG